MSDDVALLDVRGLKTWFGSSEKPIRAVNGVSFRVPTGRMVALVGESGCGKSVTALSLGRLVPEPPGYYPAGQIFFDGEDVLTMSERKLHRLRGRGIGYVFQEPAASLNPVVRIGTQIMEGVRLHRRALDARDEALRLLSLVGLVDPVRRMRAYPHQLSGGMQQRVMLAMALASNPRLLVADEPTTALDVTIQAQILELLVSLQRRLQMSVLLITHNLGLVAETAEFVNVMYAGRVVEAGRVEDVLSRPAHPYTRGLLRAVPRLAGRSATSGPSRLMGIPGSVPHPEHLPDGCAFHPRCDRCQATCRSREPVLRAVGAGTSSSADEADPGVHRVGCWFPLEEGVGCPC